MLKKTNIILIIVASIFWLSACDGENGESTKEKNKNNTNNEKKQQEETFDVHGIELKVKEEPEKIEKAEEIDIEVLDMTDVDMLDMVDDAFNLSEERMEEIITAIVEQDEEIFRKHNYFGDRILDDRLKQTVYMDIDRALKSDDSMEEENDEIIEEQKEQFSKNTFDNVSEYIAFREDFETKLDKDFDLHINSIKPLGDAHGLPAFYRTEDIFEYAEYKGITNINLENYNIRTVSDNNVVQVKDGDYTSGGKAISIEEKDVKNGDDDFILHLYFNKYKDGYYYLNGVEM